MTLGSDGIIAPGRSNDTIPLNDVLSGNNLDQKLMLVNARLLMETVTQLRAINDELRLQHSTLLDIDLNTSA